LLRVEVHQYHRAVEVAGEVLWEPVGVEVLAGRLGELPGAAYGAGGTELLEVSCILDSKGVYRWT
jgi:hypothetical protein